MKRPLGPHNSRARRFVTLDRLLARLNAAGQSCTAVVIGRRAVLTAAHCTYMRRTRQFLAPSSLHVLVGYARGAFRVHAGVVAIAREMAAFVWAIAQEVPLAHTTTTN